MTELQDIIARNYNLHSPTLAPAPRGFIAETHIVTTGSERYFCKIVPISKYSEFIEQTLPLLLELRQLGISHINYPIPTNKNELSIKFDNKLLILFNYIDAEWTFDYDLEKYTTLLASIHTLTESIHTPLHREDFNILSINDLKRDLKTVCEEESENAYVQQLSKTLLPYKQQITEIIARAENLATTLQAAAQLDWVITHGDPLGNIIKDKSGEVYLIDWDDAFFAPAERDTWFHLSQDKKSLFLNFYRERFPGYQPNNNAYNFYVYRRYIDDLEDFIVRILDNKTTNEKKQSYLKELQEDCFDWLHPIIHTLS